MNYEVTILQLQWMEHSTSDPKRETLGLGPSLNPVPRIFASTPSTPAFKPVSTPSAAFTLSGPAEADALPISAVAIASAPSTLALAPAPRCMSEREREGRRETD